METIGGGGADGGQKGLQIRKGGGEEGEDLLNSGGSRAILFKGTSDCIFLSVMT